MARAYAALLLIVATLGGTSAEFEACGLAGICANKNKYSCDGAKWKSGLCPGSSAFVCCPAPAGIKTPACEKADGVCMRQESCTAARGTVVHGKCPGAKGVGVKCCSSSGGGVVPRGSAKAALEKLATEMEALRKVHKQKKTQAYGDFGEISITGAMQPWTEDPALQKNLFNLQNLLQCATKKPSVLSIKGWSELESDIMKAKQPLLSVMKDIEAKAATVVAVLTAKTSLAELATLGDVAFAQILSKVVPHLAKTQAAIHLANKANIAVHAMKKKKTTPPVASTPLELIVDGKHSESGTVLFDAMAPRLVAMGKCKTLAPSTERDACAAINYIGAIVDTPAGLIWDFADFVEGAADTSESAGTKYMRELTQNQLTKINPKTKEGYVDEFMQGPKFKNFRLMLSVYGAAKASWDIFSDPAAMTEIAGHVVAAADLAETFGKRMLKSDGVKMTKWAMKSNAKAWVKVIGKVAAPLDTAVAFLDLVYTNLYTTGPYAVAAKTAVAIASGVVAVLILSGIGAPLGALGMIAVQFASVAIDFFKDDACQVLVGHLKYDAGDSMFSDDVARTFINSHTCPTIMAKLYTSPPAGGTAAVALTPLASSSTAVTAPVSTGANTKFGVARLTSLVETLLTGSVTGLELRAARTLIQCVAHTKPESYGAASAATPADKCNKKCPGCTVVKEVVSTFGLEKLLKSPAGWMTWGSSMKGTLKECGIMSDAYNGAILSRIDKCTTGCKVDAESCKFLKADSEGCTALSKESVDNKVYMINALFSGVTGDRDEKAIKKVWECTSDADREKLIEKGITYDRFHSDFHGDEWTDMEKCLKITADAAATDDNIGRQWVKETKCATIRSMVEKPTTAAANVQKIGAVVEAMLSGWTGSADEEAIIKLFTCLDHNTATCAAAGSIVQKVTAGSLRWRINGDNWRQLKTAIGPDSKKCKIHLGEGSGQKTVDYINKYICDCSVDENTCDMTSSNKKLVAGMPEKMCVPADDLATHNLELMITKLFAWWTGDEDAKAIYKLFKCLPADRRRELQLKDGFKYEDFRSQLYESVWAKMKMCLVEPVPCMKQGGNVVRVLPAATGACKCTNYVMSCTANDECSPDSSNDGNKCSGDGRKCICEDNWWNDCICVQDKKQTDICEKKIPDSGQ